MRKIFALMKFFDCRTVRNLATCVIYFKIWKKGINLFEVGKQGVPCTEFNPSMINYYV